MMLVLQTPLPPDLPMRAQETILIAMTIVAITIGAIFVLKPLILALSRRIEAKGTAPSLRAEIESLHERIAEVEPLQRRVLELEERLEFTERLLAQRRDQEVIGPRGAS